MSKKHVIIEAPGKVAKIRHCLGNDFEVFATAGHISDLPEKGLNIDIEDDFKTTYEVYPDKKQLVKELVEKAKSASAVYLMTDADREGEMISFLVSTQLPKSVKFSRITTGSITKSAILDAIKAPRSIDMDMVSAAEARRVLDRLCGYKTSFLVKMATGGASAGRVQSAGLRILAEREKEIRAFKPEEFWPVWVELLTEQKEKVIAHIKSPDEKDIKNGDQAKAIVEEVKAAKKVTVSKYEKKDVFTRTQPPFTTASLYQAAASVFGWKADKTAKVAQGLYEAGAITYHRTDSMFIIPEVVGAIRDKVATYGKPYLPDKPNYFGNPKNAQEAHEACRVTDIATESYTSGDPDQAHLYKMIWKRTVASQMTDMKKLAVLAEFKVGKFIFAANGSKLLFDGWRKVWDYGDVTDTTLPEMKVGDKLDIIDIKTEQKFTQPPPRYTERSFNKELEKQGIGRPSTYASIPKILEQRGYIENKKSITVTDLGLRVNDFLCQVPFCFVDIGFTADMETKLDDILEKKKTKLDVLNEFWIRLKADINKSKEFKKEKVVSEFPCPKCEKKGEKAFLVLRESRFGKFFSCENYSKSGKGCDYKAQISEDGKPLEVEKKEVKKSDFKCPECGSALVVRVGKKSGKEFLGCPKWKPFNKGCKAGIFDMNGQKIEMKKKWGKKKSGKAEASNKSDDERGIDE
jgi:DNA topoisomerase-1